MKQSEVGEGRLILCLAPGIQVDGADRELAVLTAHFDVGVHLEFCV